MSPSASQLIDQRIRDLGDWRGETLARMRELILEAEPAAIEEWKWMGTPVWSREGIICTGESYKAVVKLTFAHGASIPDPSRLFNSSLEGNMRRAIDIREGEKVDARAFKALVKAAVARNLASGPAKKRAMKASPAPARTAGKATPRAKATSRASKPRKAKAGAKGAKAKPAASKPSKPSKAKPKKVVLLSGGNPQIAKGDGDAPVQAYIAAMPGWKRDVGKRLDAVIVRSVPGVHKAVKWNSPMYGIEGLGFFLAVHVYARYIKVAFFRGASLQPLPPGPSKDRNTRYVDIHEGELDEAQMAIWIKQAAALPGWTPGRP